MGFFFSLMFIWIVSYFFVDTLVTYDLDPKIDKYVFTPGSTIKYRTEGWGTTNVGRYGVNAVPDITRISGPKVLIWGNSYVEAFQVDDQEKMPQVLTYLFHSDGLKDLFAFGVGHSGDRIAQYYFDIPKYEQIASPIYMHFIILGSIVDVLPDNRQNRSNFISKQGYSLVENKWEPLFQKEKAFLKKYELHFIWDLLRSTIKNLKPRFRPGPVLTNSDNGKSNESKESPREAWSFLLKQLRMQTTKPIVFVYSPTVPRIEESSIVFSDQDAKLIKIFAEECFRHNIGFINMADDFSEYYRRTGRFPRGFANYRPAEGHFNSEGHRLIAEAIFKYIKVEKRSKHALYTN